MWVIGGLLLVAALVLLAAYHTRYPGVMVFQRLLAASCLATGLLQFAGLGRRPAAPT